MLRREAFYIGGAWVPAHQQNRIEVRNPSTEEVIGTVAEADAGEVDQAVDAARRAFDSWAQTSPAERAAYLTQIVAGLKSRSDELAQIITSEVGMPLKMCKRMQVGAPIAIFDSYATLLASYTFSEELGNSLVVREPVGVVTAITAWNYPLYLMAAKIAPALAAGCTVVLKPSEITPLCAYLLAEVIDQAHLPAGVFNLVVGTGPATGEALVRHPDVDMVTFTGSTRGGKRVGEVAAGSVKRVALELGGKSASVVLEDADLASAVRSTVNLCFLNSGQTCAAHTRMLVHESKYDEAARIAVDTAAGFTVGDPFADTTKLGPLVSATQRDRVRGYIRKGVEQGAELLCGGAEAPDGIDKGYYVKPTVFGRVESYATIAREEIFGPVLSVLSCKDDDDAVRIANSTDYGLAGGVWSADQERAKRVARRMRAGQVDINGGPFNLLAPFGGFKQSGHGREMGRFGLEEFLEYKALQFKRA